MMTKREFISWVATIIIVSTTLVLLGYHLDIAGKMLDFIELLGKAWRGER